MVLSPEFPLALASSPTELLTQPDRMTPQVEALQAPVQQAPVKTDKFASINTTQPTSCPRIPLPVVRYVRWGLGQVGMSKEHQKCVARPMPPRS